jgi:hypothetical protein
MSFDDERTEYLAGGDAGGLDPAELAELDDLRALLADPATWAEPDPGLEDRVVAVVTVEARARPAGGTEGAGGRRRLRTRILAAGAGLAVAAAVVVGLLVVGSDPEQRGVELALEGTELRPGAAGAVTVRSGRTGLRLDLDATGLPRRDDGRFYQAWLGNGAGDLVSVGTFHEAEGVVLWAGVALEDFPTVTVTEEEADGDEASSGRVVLTGTAPG